MPASGRGRGRPTPQGPFPCEECGKFFERKEYRDKHYRRCLRAANEPRQTRQRSCVSCVASKLGCDQRIPTCSRCALRGKRCQYATGPKSNGRVEQQDSSLAGSEELVQHEPGYLRFDGASGSRLGPEESEMNLNGNGQIQRSGNGPVGHDNGTDTGNGTAWPMAPSMSGVGIGVGVQQSPDRSMKDVNMMSDWLRQSPSQGLLVNGDSESTHWPAYRWPSSSPSVTMGEATSIPPEWDDTFQLGMMGMGNDMNFDLLGSLGVLPPRSSVVPSATPARRPSLRSRRNTEPPPPLPPPPQQPQQQQQLTNTTFISSHEDQTFRDYVPTTTSRQTAAILAHPTPQTTSPTSTSPSASCPFHKLTSDLDTVDIICSYPRLMLRPGIYPPFVHHKIYPCAEGEILEPLAKAFCCVGAFYASVKTSEGFVYQLMNNESRRLVNGFQLWSTSDHSMLAAVHAMAIYQILGFFTCTNPEQTRLAELQQLFFLKMVRKLITAHLSRPFPSNNTTPTTKTDDNESTNWRKWIVNETIRRTVFLANTINTLSYRTQKQNPYYYEALDDDSVLNMLLPAPMSVWKASSEEEWLAAKANLNPEERSRSTMTVQTVLDQFTGQGIIGRGGRRGRERHRLNFDELDEFSRIVISTAKAY
ncbi:hypothetical protein BJX64DRAFT_288557 [Aspergillus heterothallicus]